MIIDYFRRDMFDQLRSQLEVTWREGEGGDGDASGMEESRESAQVESHEVRVQPTTMLDGWTQLPNKYQSQLQNEGKNRMSRMRRHRAQSLLPINYIILYKSSSRPCSHVLAFPGRFQSITLEFAMADRTEECAIDAASRTELRGMR
eukprot:754086-Hanusia_phi.AAC.14